MPSVLLLLAEDEHTVAAVLNAALTDAGYEVLGAGNGNEAIKEIEADAARFRAVVTDIQLGTGPEGWEIARRARELVPTMPIIYMSGESAEEWTAKGVPGSLMMIAETVRARSTRHGGLQLDQRGRHARPTRRGT